MNLAYHISFGTYFFQICEKNIIKIQIFVIQTKIKKYLTLKLSILYCMNKDIHPIDNYKFPLVNLLIFHRSF